MLPQTKRTPLQCAAANGHVDVLKLLLDSNANKNKKDTVRFLIITMTFIMLLICVVKIYLNCNITCSVNICLHRIFIYYRKGKQLCTWLLKMDILKQYLFF